MTMSFYHAAIIYSTKMYYKIHKYTGIYNYLYDYNIAAPMMRTAIIVMKKQRNSAPDPAFEKGSVMKTSSTVGLVIL